MLGQVQRGGYTDADQQASAMLTAGGWRCPGRESTLAGDTGQGVEGMSIAKRFGGYAVLSIAALAIAACSNLQDPAKHAVESVDAAVSSAAPTAQKYRPEQFAALQVRVASLKASFDKGDYNRVLADAPTLLNDIQALAAIAAAKKEQIRRNLVGVWPKLSASMPASIAAVQARIDALSKNKRDAAKVDLPSAKASMADAGALWSKAQDSFTAGDIETAVDTAKEVQNKIDAAAASLKFTLPSAPAH